MNVSNARPRAFERILVDTWLQPSNNFSAQSGRSLFVWIFEKLGVLGREGGHAGDGEKVRVGDGERVRVGVGGGSDLF